MISYVCVFDQNIKSHMTTSDSLELMQRSDTNQKNQKDLLLM